MCPRPPRDALDISGHPRPPASPWPLRAGSVDTQIAARPDTDRPGRINQTRTVAGRRVRIPHTCTLSTDRTPATTAPMYVPVGRNALGNRRSEPQRHVACNRELHEVVSAEPGARVQNAARKRPVHKGVHNVHAPIGRTNTRGAHSARFAEGSHPTKMPGKIRLRHVVTTTPDHERVKANNWPPLQPERTTHTPRFQQTEGPQARTLIPPPTKPNRRPRRQAQTADSVRGTREGSMSTH